MNIKKLIGQRIQDERKARGLTQTKLAELAGDLKQPRINNWEHGIRTPGPQEIKQLAHILEVSPAYLMCLTDRKQPDKNHLGALVPLLNARQLNHPEDWANIIIKKEYEEETVFIPIAVELAKIAGQDAFMLKMEDESMAPELQCNDLLLINPDYIPKPGNLVLAQREEDSELIIRRYKQLSISKTTHHFELLATNKHWPNILGNEQNGCKILGTVIYLYRPMITISP